jgi:hypothetical protein
MQQVHISLFINNKDENFEKKSLFRISRSGNSSFCVYAEMMRHAHTE